MAITRCRQKKKEDRVVDTIRRVRFYDALAAKDPDTSITDVAAIHRISTSYAYKLRAKLETQGEAAYRTANPFAKPSGPKPKISAEKMQEILADDNPVRDCTLATQIKHFGLECSKRTLARQLAKHGKRVQKLK